MQYIQQNLKKLWTAGIFCAFLAFIVPAHSYAEEMPEQEMLKQDTGQLPSFGGKLDLTPQTKENISDTEKKAEENSLTKNENLANLQEKSEQTVQPAQKTNQPRPPVQKAIILAPGSHHSAIMEEDGSDVMIVHGSNKIPENYTNSTNMNNGFYMNITNPDGSGMNMGTYFNSNSSANSPRKQSKAQMIIDKME